MEQDGPESEMHDQPMTERDRIEQARTLYDAGLFRRKVIERSPLDIHDDLAKLECGHTTRLPRRWSKEDTEWECYQCRKPYEPKSETLETTISKKYLRRWYTPWYLTILPAVVLIAYLVLVLPSAINSANKRELEIQDMKKRITALEERLKSK